MWKSFVAVCIVWIMTGEALFRRERSVHTLGIIGCAFKEEAYVDENKTLENVKY